MIDKETANNLLGESKTELVDMLCNMSYLIDDYEAKEKTYKAALDELKEYLKRKRYFASAGEAARTDILQKLEEITDV